jgi:hypothetical protein
VVELVAQGAQLVVAQGVFFLDEAVRLIDQRPHLRAARRGRGELGWGEVEEEAQDASVVRLEVSELAELLRRQVVGLHGRHVTRVGEGATGSRGQAHTAYR